MEPLVKLLMERYGLSREIATNYAMSVSAGNTFNQQLSTAIGARSAAKGAGAGGGDPATPWIMSTAAPVAGVMAGSGAANGAGPRNDPNEIQMRPTDVQLERPRPPFVMPPEVARGAPSAFQDAAQSGYNDRKRLIDEAPDLAAKFSKIEAMAASRRGSY